MAWRVPWVRGRHENLFSYERLIAPVSSFIISAKFSRVFHSIFSPRKAVKVFLWWFLWLVSFRSECWVWFWIDQCPYPGMELRILHGYSSQAWFCMVLNLHDLILWLCHERGENGRNVSILVQTEFSMFILSAILHSSVLFECCVILFWSTNNAVLIFFSFKTDF